MPSPLCGGSTSGLDGLYIMKLHLSVLLALLPLSLGVAGNSGDSAPCIPEGGKSAFEFERPELGQEFDPTGAEWINGKTGDPKGKEEDVLYDDELGAATPGEPPTKATLEIENKSGKLSGPNGVVQNGGGEGDCIEVYLEWTYRYPATITRSASVKLNGFGVGSSVSVTVWMFATKKSKVMEICPC